MKKLGKRVVFCLLLVSLAWCGTLIADRQLLDRQLVRLHVAAASDTPEDQRNQVLVRDAIVESLTKGLQDTSDPSLARDYIEKTLPGLREIAAAALRSVGCDDAVAVWLGEEAADAGVWEDFSLPAGIYDTLRVTIGRGTGESRWYVVCPVGEGDSGDFPESLYDALREGGGHKIRFFLLDVLGRLEQILRRE